MNETRGLWRGKRVDTKEWVEGYYFHQSKTCTTDDIHYIVIHKGFGFAWFRVDPSTLGECTGLHDKNGKLIFEGDIIKTKKYGKVVGHSNVNDYDIFVVKYEPAVFRLENHNREFNLVDDGYGKFEIIGNIPDTPELLKGED